MYTILVSLIHSTDLASKLRSPGKPIQGLQQPACHQRKVALYVSIPPRRCGISGMLEQELF